MNNILYNSLKYTIHININFKHALFLLYFLDNLLKIKCKLRQIVFTVLLKTFCKYN